MMKLFSSAIADGERIPTKYAFGKHHPRDNVELSDNLSPPLSWSDVPAETRSLVLICHDPDVPSRGDDVNKEGRTVPASLPRVDFFHWILIDIPASTTTLAEGAHSRGVTAHGKKGPDAEGGLRHGINDYTSWFAGDESMKGDYYGYDGPCPPWNDQIVHHYHFTLFATDLARVPVEGRFTGSEVRKAIEGHVLAQASLVGLYSIYPKAIERS